jgi:hypothetical protein
MLKEYRTISGSCRSSDVSSGCGKCNLMMKLGEIELSNGEITPM